MANMIVINKLADTRQQLKLLRFSNIIVVGVAVRCRTMF